jgi:predicted nuclease with TOPRIM domain
MALKVSFEKNTIGVPMPDCYIKVDSVFYDGIHKSIQVQVAFYVNQEQRLNDIRDKRKAIDTQIEAKKAEMVSEKEKLPEVDPENPDNPERLSRLESLEQQLMTLYDELEDVTGETPFYAKRFEFPVSGTEPQNIVELAYTKLKASNFIGRDDGRIIELDFTKAQDV